ncbi:hypothetical protein AQUCO_00400168v1 [Aquilegia coerulea]|uniref:Uncharacterized protein n=1 Tax=Aquilegia coerulea TaxID=218851 RepID=A0A2G5ETR7_AQUCA|nr:hypothetical protein AQUCO_00400168v1 [Aquilegia coerulea]
MVVKFYLLLNSIWLKIFGEALELVLQLLNPQWKSVFSAGDYIERRSTLHVQCVLKNTGSHGGFLEYLR